jgi:ligand-binding sensor domain-containing protein/signal transduction histidine kinase
MRLFFCSKKLLFLSCFFLITFITFSQTNHYDLELIKKHLTNADGLADSHINTTFIDSKSNVWFLTSNKIGLLENGKVKNFAFTNAFSNKGFNAAIEDAEGNFWLSENFEWYYPFNIQRCIIFNPAKKTSLTLEQYIGRNLPIHSIIADHKHQIYISTKNGQIYRFDLKSRHLILLATLSKTPVKLLYAGKNGIIACIEQDFRHDTQIVHLDLEGEIITQETLKVRFVKSVLELDNRLFYVSVSDSFVGIKELNGTLDKQFPVSREGYLGNVIYDKNKDFFIINEGNSLGFFNKNFDLLKKEKYDFLIHHIINDANGNLFLSTNNGVHILRLIEQKIKTFLKNDESDKINDNYSCRGILKIDNDNVIVNTNKKRHLINLKTGNVKTLHDFNNQKGTDYRFVLTVLKDKDGDLLFGEDALIKTDLQQNKDIMLCNLDSTKIWAIAQYKEGLLLGLEKKGIIYFDKKSRKTKQYPGIDKTLKNSIIYDFFMVNENEVLVASEAGLYRMMNDAVFQKITFPKQNDDQMTCFSIRKDKKQANQLLIASISGIWIYDLTKRTLVPFIQDIDFQSKKYLSAYRTNNGVWASSDEGIWHFDDKGVLLKTYTETDGLTTKECNRLAHHQDANDILYFGGVNGLNVINPAYFSSQKEKQFDIKIDAIYTYEGLSKNRELVNFKQPILALDRDESSVELVLSYEDFKYDCTKKYYYRSDKSVVNDWLPLSDRKLLLNNIDHGTTNVEIRVVSCDSFTEARIQKLTINRKKPLYLEWYFLPIILIILGLLVWGVITYSTYQLKLRNEILQKKVDEQTHSLQQSLTLKETLLSLLVHDVRYPVQSFYDLSKKLAYLTKKNDHERLFLLGKETENKSRKVLWLIDELVYWVKSTNKSWDLNLQESNLGEMMNQIFDIYADELKEKSLSFEIINADTKAKVDYGLLIIILRNLLFNAIVHSRPQSKISIMIATLENKYLIQIDNKKSNESNSNNGLGLGLTLLLPLLEKANITLDKEESGDAFIAKIQFEKNK